MFCTGRADEPAEERDQLDLRPERLGLAGAREKNSHRVPTGVSGATTRERRPSSTSGSSSGRVSTVRSPRTWSGRRGAAARSRRAGPGPSPAAILLAEARRRHDLGDAVLVPGDEQPVERDDAAQLGHERLERLVELQGREAAAPVGGLEQVDAPAERVAESLRLRGPNDRGPRLPPLELDEPPRDAAQQQATASQDDRVGSRSRPPPPPELRGRRRDRRGRRSGLPVWEEQAASRTTR